MCSSRHCPKLRTSGFKSRRLQVAFRQNSQRFLVASCLKNIVPQGQCYVSEKVGITEPLEGFGRRLIALEDLEPEEVLISFPMEDAFSVSEVEGEESNLPWSVELALQVLRAKTDSDSSGKYKGWFEKLPEHIDLPVTTFTDEELTACGDQTVIEDTQSVRNMLETSIKVLEEELLELKASQHDFLQAVGAVHSRVFIQAQTADQNSHLLTYIVAPGIDMANHSFWPNAAVQMHSSPEACQGLDAASEVCDTDGVQPTQLISLAVTEDPIRKGEEITLCYGNHSDEAFYMYFGFLPTEEDFNTVTLFHSQVELQGFFHAKTQQAHQQTPAVEQLIIRPQRYYGRQNGAFDAALCSTILEWLQDGNAINRQQAPKASSSDSSPRPQRAMSENSETPLDSQTPSVGSEDLTSSKKSIAKKLPKPSKKQLRSLKSLLNARCRQLYEEYQSNDRTEALLRAQSNSQTRLSLEFWSRKLRILKTLIEASA